jgi:hypothetical protein
LCDGLANDPSAPGGLGRVASLPMTLPYRGMI